MKSILFLLTILMALNAGAQDTAINTYRSIPTLEHYNRMTPKCPHIYVSVMDSVVERQSVLDLSLRLSIPRSGIIDDTLPSYRPTGPKIVCILCHRVTNQVVKYETGGVTMPVGGSIKLDTLRSNFYTQYNQTKN